MNSSDRKSEWQDLERMTIEVLPKSGNQNSKISHLAVQRGKDMMAVVGTEIDVENQ